ncbi:MAG: hypothetical protein M0026_09605 [Nocardiopsaceae bacterium]|nr:hypothetical protein [Nocardiopsaceae bacterium]
MPHDPPASSDHQPSRPTVPGTHGSGWVDLGKDQRLTWIAYWVLLGLFLGLPMAISAIPAYSAATSGDSETLREYVSVFALFFGVPLLVLGGLLVVNAPRYLTHQGVELSERGIGIVHHSKWWLRGETGFVPWADVHQIAWGLRKGRNPRRTLEVHLRQADHAMRLPPRWATLVLAGKEKWGSTASRPRIIFDLDRKILTRLKEELAALRPDLFKEPAERGTPTAPAEPAQGSPQRDARPPSAPETTPGPSHWVSMRWQGALGWAVATGLCVYLTVGLTVVAIVIAVVATDTGEIGASPVMLALALLCGLLSWPLVRMAPRYSTRQGVSADSTGITLVQEPKRWFSDRTAHIPWPQVRHISQDVATPSGNRDLKYIIDIELRAPFRGTELPTWAVPDGDTVRIWPSKARHAEIVQALRATRPDLFPGG